MSSQVPRLNRVDYFTKPSMRALAEAARGTGVAALACVTDFTVRAPPTHDTIGGICVMPILINEGARVEFALDL